MVSLVVFHRAGVWWGGEGSQGLAGDHRWLSYWQNADWRRLMSRRHGPLLSLDQIQLELAGYEVRKLPIAQICRGRLLGWPVETLGELVPNA